MTPARAIDVLTAGRGSRDRRGCRSREEGDAAAHRPFRRTSSTSAPAADPHAQRLRAATRRSPAGCGVSLRRRSRGQPAGTATSCSAGLPSFRSRPRRSAGVHSTHGQQLISNRCHRTRPATASRPT